MTKLVLKKWRKRLREAIKRGKFTEAEKGMSATWNACAVGERDKLCKGLIKSDDLGTNDDFMKITFGIDTYLVGLRFYDAVCGSDFTKVKNIIDLIEGLTVEEFYK